MKGSCKEKPALVQDKGGKSKGTETKPVRARKMKLLLVMKNKLHYKAQEQKLNKEKQEERKRALWIRLQKRLGVREYRIRTNHQGQSI